MTRQRLPIRPAVLWGLAALVVSLLFVAVASRSVAPVNDLWDYAQEARQMARGHGFTSLYTYPSHLGPDERPPFPVTWRMPGYAARAALGMKMGFTPTQIFFSIAVQAQVALVVLVFLLGAHFGGSRAGSIAAAAAVASPILLDPYTVGLNQTPAAALSLLAWFLLLRGGRIRSAVLAATAAAAAWYLRAEAALMLPLWIWAAWLGGRDSGQDGGGAAKRGAAFAAVFAALCVPWPIFLHAATGAFSSIHGNPMLLYTPEFPGYVALRAYGESQPGVFAYVFGHPLQFALRWTKGVATFGTQMLGGLGPVAVGLAIAGLLIREPRERYAPIRPALPLLAAIVLQIAALAALEQSPRFLKPVLPLACVLIGVAALPSLDRFCGRRMVALLFALLIGERLMTVALDARAAARSHPPLPAATVSALATRVAAAGGDSAALILTDVPDWVAWHIDRPALFLPLSRDLRPLLRDHDVAALFLTRAALARNAADRDSAWTDWIDRRVAVPGFSPPETLPGGTRFYWRLASADSTSRDAR